VEELVEGLCVGGAGRGLQTKPCCAGRRVVQRHASKVKQRRSRSSASLRFKAKP